MTRHLESPSIAPRFPVWLGALVLMLGLAVAASRALADADCGITEAPSGAKGKSHESKGKCPSGAKYSAAKKSCVKVSCGNGLVWSGEAQACTDSHSAALTEQDFYNEARTLADEGQYQAALDTLAHIKNQEQARVLNLIGYNTRKLGEVDKGLDHYHRALAIDPNYLLAREYLGEGYLQKGDLARARAELTEIADRCGDRCEEYDKLEKAIVIFMTGDDTGTSY
jgi:tetratricopeptide (TPR) repeat protein